jgi:imidazole glycerol-phosphate synthase subunit HisF
MINNFIPRIIGSLIIKNGIVCQSNKFFEYRPIGSIEKTCEYYVDWGVDELTILNTDPNLINLSILKRNIKNINIPICYGGSIKKIDDAKKLLDIGVDKISLNSLILDNFHMLEKFVNYFGSQFICASIDFKKIKNEYFIYSNKKKNIIGDNPLKLINFLNTVGVGEVMLKSVDLDGTKKGYDINLIKKFQKKIKPPLLISGGADNFKNIIQIATKFDINPVIGNVLMHRENSIVFLKEELYKKTKSRRPNKFF